MIESRLAPGARRRHGRRRLVRIFVGLVAVAVAVTAGYLLSNRTHRRTSATTAAAVTTAPVVRTDIVNTIATAGALGYGDAKPIVGQSVGLAYTALPTPGDVVGRGEQLFAVDGRPTTLFYGAAPAYRNLVQGMTGDDVLALKQNLAALGFGSAADLQSKVFDQATADEVAQWQASRGLSASRVVEVGDVVYTPAPLRVAALSVSLGEPAHAGATVLTATGTDPVVQAQLPVAQQYLVKVGDSVTVTMPDGATTVAGRVSRLSSVATDTGGQGGGGAASAGAGQGQQSGATVLMTVTVTNLPAGQHFDQAPVTVNVVSAQVKGVLAVPINALQALAGGGYGVAIDDGTARRVVAVQTGLFSATQVQISGGGIAAGQLVEVPAS